MLVGLWLTGQVDYGPLELIFQVSSASGPPGDLLGGLFGASLEASWGPPGGFLGASWGHWAVLGAEVEF